jgi:aspartyl-tRNA(Asn)/glutamyl-tRNA(Gln) amidotransferase subunit A
VSTIPDLPLAELVAAIAGRRLSPVEVMEATLARVAAINPELNAFITLSAETAMAEARQAEAAITAGRTPGALCGVPFSAKDLIATGGLRTTMGSRLFADHVPGEDAVPITRLKAAGAILIGKTTTPEFGHKPLTDSPLFGRTQNPWDAAVTCGGSSGGAGVAALTGMGAFALGTDGGGSIRIPAACCGIVGLKGTLGAVPHLQLPDLFSANSYIGPMARRVADLQLLWPLLAGPSRHDPYGQAPPPPARRLSGEGLRPLRIGVMARVGDHALDPEVERVFAGAVAAAEGLGALVDEATFDFVALEEAFLVILRSALHARLAEAIAARPSDVDPTLARTVEEGARYTAADLHGAAAARSRSFLAVQDALARFDLLLSPTLSAPPLPVDQDPHGRVVVDGRDNGRIRAGWYPYTYPFNLTGHPALTLLGGWTEGALPIALQLVGAWHQEALLLDVAERLERELGATRAWIPNP